MKSIIDNEVKVETAFSWVEEVLFSNVCGLEEAINALQDLFYFIAEKNYSCEVWVNDYMYATGDEELLEYLEEENLPFTHMPEKACLVMKPKDFIKYYAETGDENYEIVITA